MSSTREHACYETEKLVLAAYLIASGQASLLGTKPVQHSRNVVFLLSARPSADEITHFFSGAATVSALRYAETINTLKGAAYEGRKRGDSI